MYWENEQFDRWERQKQVLLLLHGNWFSVKDLSDYLNIDIKHSDSLLRLYYRHHYLKRKKFEGKFHYTLTNWGLTHLKWLEEGRHLPYREWYQQTYTKSPLEKLKEDYMAIVELKEKLK